jgi:hypothetical protein
VACPAETGLPALIRQFVDIIWPSMLPGELGDGGETPLPEDLVEQTRRVVGIPMAYYCEREGKRIFCDKSLDSARSLSAVNQVFPEARYILVFRHVMDAVASGLDASPWGFDAFGYAPFVQASPGNLVQALASCWNSYAEAALSWEKEQPEKCLRVRYEDLVTRPRAVMTELFEFLGVEADLAVLSRAFAGGKALGDGMDYKVPFTSGVHAESIGSGRRVPVARIPPPLLEAVNEKMLALGYPALDEDWNSHGQATAGRSEAKAALAAAFEGLTGSSDKRRVGRSWAIIADDDDKLRWYLDAQTGEIRRGDGQVETALLGTAEDLVAFIDNTVNVGALVRAGRVRHFSSRKEVSTAEIRQNIAAILADVRGSQRDGHGRG